MLAFLAWELFVGFAIVGWGYVGRRALRLDQLPDRVAIDFVIGIALLGFVGALLMLVHDVTTTEWVFLVVLGAIAAAVRSALLVVESLGVGWRALWPRVAISTVSAVVVGALATGNVATRTWNPCDDDPAYLYLAKRLWGRGNLTDSFNNRRLASSGLFSLLQGISIGPLHEGALYAADLVFGAMLLLFVLWRRRDGRFSVVGLVITLLVVTSLAILGEINSSPVLLPIAIMVCALDPSLWRSARSGAHNAVFVAIAVAVLTLMRPFLGLVLAATFVVYQLWVRRPGWPRRLGVFAGAGAAVTLPWLLMQKRDSGTWLYPAFSGNLSPGFPIEGYKSMVDPWDYLGKAASQLFSWYWPFAIGFALAATFVLTAWAERRRTGADSDDDRGDDRGEDSDDRGDDLGGRELRLLHSLVSAFAVAFFFAFALSVRRSGLPGSFPRFWAPLLAAAILTVYWTSTSVAIPDRWLRRVGTGLCLVSVGLLVTPSVVSRARNSAEDVIHAFTEEQYSQTITKPRYGSSERSYASVLDRIPEGARVLSAVELPHLLLRGDLDLQTLDIAGSTGPRPDFPFSGTDADKVAWLTAHDFDYVVVTLPVNTSCLYSEALWKQQVDRADVYGDWAPFILQWTEFADTIAPAAIREAGEIALVRVRDLTP